MNVVNDQGIDVPIFLAKIAHALGADRFDQFIGELFGAKIDDFQPGFLDQHLVADGVKQMGFAQPRSPIYEQRVVSGGVVGHGHGGGVGQLIGIAHDEVGESVFFIQVRCPIFQTGKCRDRCRPEPVAGLWPVRDQVARTRKPDQYSCPGPIFPRPSGTFLEYNSGRSIFEKDIGDLKTKRLHGSRQKRDGSQPAPELFGLHLFFKSGQDLVKQFFHVFAQKNTIKTSY